MEQLMLEATANTTEFFRSPGGNPGNVKNGEVKPWNKKFTSTSKAPCKYHNSGTDHPVTSEVLYPDGTCRFNHVCDKWVSNKGKKGRCMDPGYVRDFCTNPHQCDACVN